MLFWPTTVHVIYLIEKGNQFVDFNSDVKHNYLISVLVVRRNALTASSYSKHRRSCVGLRSFFVFLFLRVSGGLLGRALGVGMVYIWQDVAGTSYPTNQWQWMDPGVTAALGSAALLGGVNRLEVASTGIVVRKQVL